MGDVGLATTYCFGRRSRNGPLERVGRGGRCKWTRPASLLGSLSDRLGRREVEASNCSMYNRIVTLSCELDQITSTEVGLRSFVDNVSRLDKALLQCSV